MSFEHLKELVEELGATIKARLDEEKAEREALELRIQRMGIGGAAPTGGDPADEHKAVSRFIRTGDDTELKALSVGSDPDGGYTVQPVMSARMTRRLYDMSPMRRLARIETIETGDAWEEIDDRDEAGATWVGESTSRPATDTPTLGKFKVNLNEIYALQPVTQRLLDDTNRDLGGWIEGKISDKFARSEGTAFVTGNGLLRPRGLLTYDTTEDDDFSRAAGKIQYVKTGHATSFPSSAPADILRSLMWSLRGPYRAGATWLMNSNTASAIDKFKDGMGDYIWRQGMTAGAQSSLLGYPVELDEDMPDLGADAFPIAFGNFKLSYVVVDRPGIRYLRDPFTSKPNVLFYAYRRVGGGLANDDAVKLLKCAA